MRPKTAKCVLLKKQLRGMIFMPAGHTALVKLLYIGHWTVDIKANITQSFYLSTVQNYVL